MTRGLNSTEIDLGRVLVAVRSARARSHGTDVSLSKSFAPASRLDRTRAVNKYNDNSITKESKNGRLAHKRNHALHAGRALGPPGQQTALLRQVTFQTTGTSILNCRYNNQNNKPPSRQSTNFNRNLVNKF